MQRQAPVIGNVINKYIELSTPTDRIKADRDSKYRNEIVTTLRHDVAALPYDQAVQLASQLDGLISIIILIVIIDELKLKIEKKLSDEYGIATKGLCESFEKEFESYLDKHVVPNKEDVSIADLATLAKAPMEKCWKSATKKSQPQPTLVFEQLIKNYIFLVTASKVYRETDDLQTANMAAVAWKTWSWNSRRFVQPYKGLVLGANTIQITADSASQWQEVACWLHGLHNRVYLAIPTHNKDKNGEVTRGPDGHFPTIDDADSKFKKHKKITKYEMARYNRELAGELETMLRRFTNKPGEPVSLATTSSSSSSSSAQASPLLTLVSNVSPEQLEITTHFLEGDEKGMELIIRVPPDKCDKDTKERLLAAVEAILHPKGLIVDENELPHHLSSILQKNVNDGVHVDDDTKIRHLHFCLKKYQFTPNQNEKLGFIPDAVRAGFKAYRNKHYLFPSVHAEKSSMVEKEILNARNPADQLHALFALRNELISDNSDTLKKTVDHILLAAFNDLSTNIPRLMAAQVLK